jgi:hypothetical protein
MQRPSLPDHNKQNTENKDKDPVSKRVGISRFLRIPFLGVIRRRFAHLVPDPIKESWRVFSGFIQAIFLVIFAFVALALVLSALTRITIVEPDNGAEVLNKVEQVEDISWSVETVRNKKIGQENFRADSLRGYQVDLQNNKFQIQALGLRERSFRMVGDGKIALYQEGDSDAGRIPYPNPNSIRPVLASDLEPVVDKIVTNEFSIQGERGWLVQWKPNSKLILQLLGAELFALEGEDIAQIRAGRFQVLYALVSVSRSSPRIYQIDTSLLVNQAQLRILATYRKNNSGDLKDLKLERSE